MKKIICSLVFTFFSTMALLAQDPVTEQAELGSAGVEWLTLPDASAAIYVTPATTGAGNNPGTANRVISYTIAFPKAGSYDLYIRMRVNSGGANDDSFFYGNGFGTKSPANDNDWITANGLFSFGYTKSSDVVEAGGQASTGVWKWLNLSEYNGGGSPVTFVVPEGNLTQTFQIGAREDGFDIDKLVFGLSDHYYTVSDLQNGQAGSTTPPPPPFVPQGPPIAQGKEKFLGCAYSDAQKVNFEKYWNQVVPENAGKWGSVEPTRDNMNWAELDASYKLAKDSGYVFRFHVLLWGNQQPSWMENLSPAEQLEEIREWFTAVANRYPDIDLLEVVNEPVNDPPSSAGNGGGNYINALGGTGATGWDWIIKAFEMAREIFPAKTKLMINEYNLENVGSVRSQYLTIINLLKERNLIDAVGTQAHAFSLRGSSASITASLNELAATGLPLYATEFDIDDRIPPSTTGSDDVQLQEYQRIFPLYWEHPSIMGVTLWGYRPGHWRTDQGAYVAHSDGAERAALKWLRSYVEAIGNQKPVVTSAQSFAINDKVENNAVVGTVAATDPDVNTTLQDWRIDGGTGADNFSINASSGEVGVSNRAAIDFENTSSYTLQVSVSDGAARSAAETVTIHLTHVPVITPDQVFAINEWVSDDYLVGVPKATDKDPSTQFQSWKITGGTGASLFAVNASTGEIRSTNSSTLNFSGTSSYTLTLTVSDGANISSGETITITLSDKVDICHFGKTMTVRRSKVPDHIKHGDDTAACETITSVQNAKMAVSNTHFAGNKSDEIQVYPNPSKGEVYVNLGANLQNIKAVQVLDMTGKAVLRIQVNDESVIRLSNGGLKPGIYILRMHGNEVVNRKIVIQ